MKNPFIVIALAIALQAQVQANEIRANFRNWRKPSTTHKLNKGGGKYAPHQGKKECARRAKQLTKGAI